MIVFLMLFAANGHIYYKFCIVFVIFKDLFKKDFKEFWSICNCSEFKEQYCSSMTYYSILSIALIGLMFLKLLVACCFCYCNDKKRDDKIVTK